MPLLARLRFWAVHNTTTGMGPVTSCRRGATSGRLSWLLLACTASFSSCSATVRTSALWLGEQPAATSAFFLAAGDRKATTWAGSVLSYVCIYVYRQYVHTGDYYSASSKLNPQVSGSTVVLRLNLMVGHTTPERVVKKLQDIQNMGKLLKTSMETFHHKPPASLIEKLLFVECALT